MKLFFINSRVFTNMSVFKKNTSIKIIFTNNENYLNLNISTHLYDCQVEPNIIGVVIQMANNLENFLCFKRINFYLKHLYSTFFFKIRFNGKGFRIQSFRNKKTMNFTFGYSHMYLLHLKNVRYKRISKYKYFYICKTTNGANILKNLFRKIKPINAYTLRGLRVSRTTIVKRKGRKSPNL